jgi:hypothetical protein
MTEKLALGVFIRAAGLYWFWKACDYIWIGIIQHIGLLPHERVSSAGWILESALYLLFATLCLKRADMIADRLYPCSKNQRYRDQHDL